MGQDLYITKYVNKHNEVLNKYLKLLIFRDRGSKQANVTRYSVIVKSTCHIVIKRYFQPRQQVEWELISISANMSNRLPNKYLIILTFRYDDHDEAVALCRLRASPVPRIYSWVLLTSVAPFSGDFSPIRLSSSCLLS